MDEARKGEKDPSKRERIRGLRMAWTVVFAAASVGLIAFVLLYSRILAGISGPMDVGRDFIEFAAEGEYGSAYALTNDAFKAEATEEQLMRFIEDNEHLANAESVIFSDRDVDDESAVLSGTITSSEGEEPVTIHLGIDANGDWKVIFFSLLPEDAPGFEEEAANP